MLRKYLAVSTWCAIMLTLIFLAMIFDWRL